jgi:3-hydroxyacyl-[acyl-carrier-protein] dehydratase
VTYVSERQYVAATHPALPGHFPRAPIVPGAWLLTLVEACCREHLRTEIAVAQLDFVRFRAPLLPDQPFRIALEVESGGRIRFTIVTDGAQIADGRLTLRASG